MTSITGGVCRYITRMASSYVTGTHSMAFVTVPNMTVGKKLAHGIVRQRLAACVNIIPSVTSVYEWEGEINEDPELILMIKTSTEKVPELSKFVRSCSSSFILKIPDEEQELESLKEGENHPYDCAEVISSKIDDGNEPYLKWIGETVSSPVITETTNGMADSTEKKPKTGV